MSKYQIKPPGPKELEAWNDSVHKEQIDNTLTHEARDAIARAFLEFQGGVTTFMPDSESRPTLFWLMELQIDAEAESQKIVNIYSGLRDTAPIDHRVFCQAVFSKDGRDMNTKVDDSIPQDTDLSGFFFSTVEYYPSHAVMAQFSVMASGIGRYLTDAGYSFVSYVMAKPGPNSGPKLKLVAHNPNAHFPWVQVIYNPQVHFDDDAFIAENRKNG